MIDMRKTLFRATSVFGILIGLAGIAFVGIYILEAIVRRAGEPDQSLLFWYLPILFTGVFGMILGFGFSAMGIYKLRRIRRESVPKGKVTEKPGP